MICNYYHNYYIFRIPLQGMFAMLAVGLAAALVVWCAELLVSLVVS